MNRAWVVFILLILGLALWGISVAIVYWDAGRRLSQGQQRLWVAAAALFPFAGFFAYWLVRILVSFLDPNEPDSRLKWVTRVQRPRGLPGQGSTIAAANIVEEPRPQPQPYPVAAGVPPAQVSRRQPWSGGPLWMTTLEGPESGKRFSLTSLPAVIGRGVEVQVPLDTDIGVSRRHAEIYLGAGLRLRDLGSTHGTYVNGTQVTDDVLHPGDRIAVGQTILQIHEDRRGG